MRGDAGARRAMTSIGRDPNARPRYGGGCWREDG